MCCMQEVMKQYKLREQAGADPQTYRPRAEGGLGGEQLGAMLMDVIFWSSPRMTLLSATLIESSTPDT